MKWLLTTDLPTFLAFVGVWVFVASYVLLLFERPHEIKNSSNHARMGCFEECLYAVVIVLTSVGYGDTAPHTQLGRVVIALNAMISVVVIAVLLNISEDAADPHLPSTSWCTYVLIEHDTPEPCKEPKAFL